MANDSEKPSAKEHGASADEDRPHEIGASASSIDEGGVPDYFSTDKIFVRVHATAEEEVDQSVRILFLSGVAAGLSLGLSFTSMSALTAAVPGSSSVAHAVGSLFYPLGFLLIVAGRYQLFTENTLTPVTLTLTGRSSVWTLLRVWGVVMTANVTGTALVALVLAHTSVFSPEAAKAAHEVASRAMGGSWVTLFWKGVFAGWLMASIVWLVHASQEDTLRFLIVFLITYTIPVSGFAHCIVGACEGLYAVFSGTASVGTFLSYFSAAAVGNTAGGVFLVAVLNYAQTQN